MQYSLDKAIAEKNMNDTVFAKSVITTSDIVKAFPKRKNPSRLLAELAKHGPQFLQSFWATPEFLEQYVYNYLPEYVVAGRYPESCSATLLNIRDTTITVQYLIEEKKIFAKFYRKEQKGAHSYRVLKTLWDGGFHNGEAYQVPEPLAYVRDHRLLLTRGADGIDIESFSDGDDLCNACIRVARWLVKLHSLSVRFGKREESAHNFLRYTAMIVKEVRDHLGGILNIINFYTS